MVKYFKSENGYFYKILNNMKIRVSKEEFKKKTKIKGGATATPGGGGGGGGEQQDNQLKAYQDYINQLIKICNKFLIFRDNFEVNTLTPNHISTGTICFRIPFKFEISDVKELKIIISNPVMRYNRHSQTPNSISYKYLVDNTYKTQSYKFTGIDEFIKQLLTVILEMITKKSIDFDIVLSKTYETNNGYHANGINVENNNNYNETEYIAMQNILSEVLNIFSRYWFVFKLKITGIDLPDIDLPA